VSVVLTSDTTEVGPGDFTATVTTVDDADLSDNESSVTLTVQPAVNLRDGRYAEYRAVAGAARG
jgi:hypothetical protein